MSLEANSIDRSELKELLLKNWMTHDGMWFYHSMQEFGIEGTNKVNKAAVRSMGMIEMKRIKKLLGVDKIENMDELKDLIAKTFEVVMGDFMKFTYSISEDNVLRSKWEPQQCFAYQGIMNMGMIDKYRCAIYDRIDAWFDALELNYTATPDIDICAMHTTGKCFREYKFDFNGE